MWKEKVVPKSCVLSQAAGPELGFNDHARGTPSSTPGFWNPFHCYSLHCFSLHGLGRQNSPVCNFWLLNRSMQQLLIFPKFSSAQNCRHFVAWSGAIRRTSHVFRHPSHKANLVISSDDVRQKSLPWPSLRDAKITCNTSKCWGRSLKKLFRLRLLIILFYLCRMVRQGLRHQVSSHKESRKDSFKNVCANRIAECFTHLTLFFRGSDEGGSQLITILRQRKITYISGDTGLAIGQVPKWKLVVCATQSTTLAQLPAEQLGLEQCRICAAMSTKVGNLSTNGPRVCVAWNTKGKYVFETGAPLQTVLFEGLRLVCFYDDRIVGQLLFCQEVLKISLQKMVKSEPESGNHRGPHLKRQSTWEGIVGWSG